MKLITLNAWGGRIKDKHKAFFDKYSDTDIFCLQEVYNKGEQYVAVQGLTIDSDFFDNIGGFLSNSKGHFCPTVENRYGLATFLNKDIEIVEQGEILLARSQYERGDHDWDHYRRLQWFEVLIGGNKLLIANVHLTHRPEGKLDSERRKRQSEMITSFLNIFDCPKILCGDFNLLPDTESVQMIENAGMKNLIKEYNIDSTRTELYKKPLRLADYIFVSSGIIVNEFKVLPDVVSDHSPLYIDFDVE